ncbi:MAG: cadmium-translocating P-type ATPase [Chloroflexi bacterium]|nr:cadmium-translocating P-type ATPase [Chloroflexota bacterium]
MDTRTVDISIDLSHCEDCELCIERVRDSLSQLKGVDAVEVNSGACNLTLSYDPDVASLSRLQDVAQNIGVGISRRFAHETIAISDMDCADCAASLERAVAKMPGVAHVDVNFALARMSVEYEPALTSHGDILSSIRALGYEVADLDQTTKTTSFFRISGLHCADCAASVERNVTSLPGVFEAKVNFGQARLTVRHRADVTAKRIIEVVERSGYGATLESEGGAEPARSFWRANRWAVFTTASGAVLLAGIVASLTIRTDLVVIPLFALAIILGGFRAARSGIFGLIASKSMDMNLLMTVAVIGAAAIGQWAEGAVVVFLFSLGNTLESYTLDRARKAIAELMSVSPNYAKIRRDGREMVLSVEQIGVGEITLVRPGERIPMDGRVSFGSSTVSQAPITGESMPVDKSAGDEVYAGSINERGYLEIEVTKPYRENMISKIIQLVEEAQAERAPSQRFVDRFARYYTPAVLLLSAAIAVLPWLILGEPFQPWIYRALVLLVISCPCALVISTPVSIVSGIARAAREGVLIKGGAHLEAAGRIKVVAFDKTGTLTLGKPRVAEVVSLGRLDEEELINLTASIEARSEHPLAAAIVRRAKHSTLDIRNVEDFEPLTGKGVKARLDGETYYVGSPNLFQSLGADFSVIRDTLGRWDDDGKTALIVGTEKEVLGAMAVGDQLREEAAEVIRELRHLGIARIVMLTGDSHAVARSIAAELGIDEVKAQLLPEQKVSAIKELLAEYGQVAMVGDGVNDAPALASATVGIAMGVAGTDAALETADIALMADDLRKVPYAVGLSRRTLATVRQNIALSLAIKIAFLVATFPGWITLWLAILADMGASLLVTLNGMSILRHKDRAHTACAEECGCSPAAHLSGENHTS